jgi:phosphonate metabolism protein (transferase hexapeptide repeat family)
MLHYIENFTKDEELPGNSPEIKLGKEPTFHPDANIVDCNIGSYVEVKGASSLRESEIGDYTYIGNKSSVVWTTIGKFCAIADNVRINPGNHPTWRPTQHHSTYRRKRYDLDSVDDTSFFEWRKSHWCSIGHDSWIGTRTTIIAGVKIGIGAVVGAGSVVTKDVADYEIVAGRPARHIRMRFSANIIDGLLKTEWWNWSYEKIQQNLNLFLYPELFLKNIS